MLVAGRLALNRAGLTSSYPGRGISSVGTLEPVTLPNTPDFGPEGAGTDAAAVDDDSARTAWPSCLTTCFLLMAPSICNTSVSDAGLHVQEFKSRRVTYSQRALQMRSNTEYACVHEPAASRCIDFDTAHMYLLTNMTLHKFDVHLEIGLTLVTYHLYPSFLLLKPLVATLFRYSL